MDTIRCFNVLIPIRFFELLLDIVPFLDKCPRNPRRVFGCPSKQVQGAWVSYSSISAWPVTQMSIIHFHLKKLSQKSYTVKVTQEPVQSFFCDLNGDLMTSWPESSLMHVWHSTKQLLVGTVIGFREEPKHVFVNRPAYQCHCHPQTSNIPALPNLETSVVSSHLFVVCDYYDMLNAFLLKNRLFWTGAPHKKVFPEVFCGGCHFLWIGSM